MKSKLGIFLVMLFISASLIYITGYKFAYSAGASINLKFGTRDYEQALSMLAEWTVISFFSGFLSFAFVHLVMGQIIKPPRKSLILSFTLSSILFMALSIIYLSVSDFPISTDDLLISVYYLGCILGFFATTIQFDNQYLHGGEKQ